MWSGVLGWRAKGNGRRGGRNHEGCEVQPSGSTVEMGRVREMFEREAKGDPAVFYYWMGGCSEDKAILFSEYDRRQWAQATK